LVLSPGRVQPLTIKIGICYFSAIHAVLRTKNKDWLVWNQNNVFAWSDMFTRGLLFQWASTRKSNTEDNIISSSKYNLFLSWYSWLKWS